MNMQQPCTLCLFKDSRQRVEKVVIDTELTYECRPKHADSHTDRNNNLTLSLTFDFVTSESVHAKDLPRTMSPVLIAQAVFFQSVDGRTDTQTNAHKVTDETDHSIHASATYSRRVIVFHEPLARSARLKDTGPKTERFTLKIECHAP